MDEYEKEYEEVYRITQTSVEALAETLMTRVNERNATINANMLIEHLVKHMCGFILCALADDAEEREEAMDIIREAVRHADKYALEVLDRVEANESTKH
tara:strand:+ start:723 stop:1019 length:297 start_codon:yes stop_codon:yes gene_type:complete